MKRLLRDKPDAVGLAVPGSSQGMEDNRPEYYDALLSGKDGNNHVYSKH